MVKLEDNESSDDKRLVLGFDGGCFTCLELARRIDERVGDKLEVQNLRAPQLQEWRKEALSEDAPWAPTLFEVEGTKVKAWTGWRMGLVLTRFLGPADTWKVMQAVGEMGAAPKIAESPAARVFDGFTRGQFLKGVGGAAVAMTVLSGAGGLPSPAAAAKKGHRGVHEIHGSQLVDVARRMARSEDTVNVAGRRWSDEMQSGEVIRECFDKDNDRKDGRRRDDDKDGHDCVIVIATGKNCKIDREDDHDKKDNDKKGKKDKKGREKDKEDKRGRGEKFNIKGNCTMIKAAKHALPHHNSRLAVAWFVPSDNRLILYREYQKPVDPDRKGNLKIETMAKLFKVGPKGRKMRLEEISVNGKRRRLRHWM